MTSRLRLWLAPLTRKPASPLRRQPLAGLTCTQLESRLNPTDFNGPLGLGQLQAMENLGLTAFALSAEIPESPIGANTYFKLAHSQALTVSSPKLLQRWDAAALAGESQLDLALPRPDGSFQVFRMWEVAMTAAPVESIKTFRGYALDNPAATLAADITPLGFHAQVLSPGGNYYIDPYYHLDTSVYVSYFGRDNYGGDPAWDCEFVGSSGGIQPQGPGPGISLQGPNVSYGGNLRTIRTAVAATGEYTAFFGGTVVNGQAAIVTSINRVSGVYEKEFAVRLQLVANNSLLVYTDGGTDPYTNNNGGAMLSQNQSNIDTVIGNANYDIGHVFSTGGGGVAAFGFGNNSVKAQGVTGQGTPTGDNFDIDYVAHEMGHQFFANHSFNAPDGNRSAADAYEPGSGSTIMSYAGIIPGNNVQAHSDDYFHAHSIGEIVTRLNAVLGVGTTTPNGNQIPVANAGLDYTIPANTPFALTGSATDGNGDPLTYNWEQYDLGPATTLGVYSSTAPLFRSIEATTNPTRTFPALTNLLNNTTSVNEVMPTGARTLNFTLTVRDNRVGGGAIHMNDMIATVAASTGFTVTAPNTAVSWTGGTSQLVTWDVASTNVAPISTANVSILLSTDGGLTFPTTILASTANDGSESIVVPNLPTGQARIKVQPVGNIYFDISNVNFTIAAGSAMQVTGTSPALGGSLTGPTATLDLIFSENINGATLSAGDLIVSAGSVTGVVLQTPNTARFTIGSLTGEGNLTATMAAGAVSSTLGNASGAFNGNYIVDAGTAAFGGAFTAALPLGSRVYTGNQNGTIGTIGDTDSFTLDLDAGQTVSAVADPDGTLRPRITLTGPGGTNATASSIAAGSTIALNSTPIAVAGTYTFTVEGISNTTGAYALQVILNAAAEGESNGGSGNNSTGTAQNLTPAFLSLGGGASLASVRGKFDGGAAGAEVEPNNSTGTATNVAATFGTYSGNVYHIGIAATITGTESSDYINIGTLQAGDILTITETGLDGRPQNTLSDPLVYLYRGTSTQVINGTGAQYDDGGVGLDSLIYRFTIATTDTYFIRGSRFNSSVSGTYSLSAYLENTGTPPTTGGAIIAEVESNNTQATATNASTSWRAPQYIATATGTIASAGDIDTFAYSFTAGDLISITARSTSAVKTRVRLLDSAGTVIALEDGTSANTASSPGNDSPIYAFRIPSTGIYYVDVQAVTGTGSYALDVYLSTATAPAVPIDHHSLTLAAGDTLTLGLKGQSAGVYQVVLLDAGGAVVATGADTATNYDSFISGFTAPAAGTYYARVSGNNTADYVLSAALNAGLDAEDNSSFAAAQDLGSRTVANGALAGNDDWYSLNLASDNIYTFTATLPGGGAGQFANTLDPRLELYTPGNVLVAGDSSGVLNVPVTTPGQYRLRVMPDAGSGEYQFSVTATPSSASVTGFSVNSDAFQRSRLTTVRVTFNIPVALGQFTGAGAVTLTRTHATTTGTIGTLVQTGAVGANGLITVTQPGPSNTIDLSFSNADASGISDGVEYGSLADGRWQLAIPSALYTSTAGDPQLRRLFGDRNNTGDVDAVDLAFFGVDFGQTAVSVFDFNNDITVDALDFGEFGGHFGVTL